MTNYEFILAILIKLGAVISFGISVFLFLYLFRIIRAKEIVSKKKQLFFSLIALTLIIACLTILLSYDKIPFTHR